MTRNEQKLKEEKYLRASMNIKHLCETYLRYKYEYYIISRTSVSDYEFDVFEKDLIETNDELALAVTNLVDFPSLEIINGLGLDIEKIAPTYDKVKKDEKDYSHLTPMLSTQKIQVNDEDNLPYNELKLFFDKVTGNVIAEEKLDGNGIEVIYKNKKLHQILTRGDAKIGKDKTSKLSLLVPKTIRMSGVVEVRGELVIKEELWQRKYKKDKTELSIDDKETGQNSRNHVGGIVTKETYIYEEINDLNFIAFSIVHVEKNKPIYIKDEHQVLKDNGFNLGHNLFTRKIKSMSEFEKLYFEFKDYRENKSEYKIDGIVLKVEYSQRNKLGIGSKTPHWSRAIKFLADVTTTKILSIEWSQSKTGELSPVAILKPVEMDGRIIRRASLANFGNIIKRRLYPGSTTSIRLAGDIIAQCIDLIIPSPDEDKYIKYYEEF